MKILGLGTSGFVMQFTNSLVQIVCNSTLQHFGDDLYVGIMTVVNSVREIITKPVSGLGSGAQPVMGFNYGAKEYKRVKTCIKFLTIISITYNGLIWLLLESFPELFIRIFNNDAEVLKAGVPVIRIFYSGFFMMALQTTGQSTFVALGKSKSAIFFSIFRKVILVLPMVIILPRSWGLGVTGVFLSEPISELIGGALCYGTMIFTVWKKLTIKEKTKQRSI